MLTSPTPKVDDAADAQTLLDKVASLVKDGNLDDADKALKKTHGNIDQAVIIALRKKKGGSRALESAVDAFVRLFYY